MARRSPKRRLVLRGFTIAEVLVAMVVGGFVVSALLLIQVQLARAGVRVRDLAQMVTTGYRITNQTSVCTAGRGPAIADATTQIDLAPWPGKVTVETVTAKNDDGAPRAGLGYTTYRSKSGELLGVVGERCALPERCDYEIASMACRQEVAPIP